MPSPIASILLNRALSGGGTGIGGNYYSENPDRYQQMARRGTAPLTMSNLGKLATNINNIMDPTSLLGAGLGSVLANATNDDIYKDIFGGFENYDDYAAIPPEERARIRTRKDYQDAIDRATARHQMERAQNFARSMSHIDAGRHGGSRGGGDRGPLGQGSGGWGREGATQQRDPF